MTTDLPPVPPAVMEFAEQNHLKHITVDELFESKKRTLQNVDRVYIGIGNKPSEFEKKDGYTYLHYIHVLVKDGRIRLATPKEEEVLNRIIFL